MHYLSHISSCLVEAQIFLERTETVWRKNLTYEVPSSEWVNGLSFICSVGPLYLVFHTEKTHRAKT